MIWMILLLLVDFIISWGNAKACGCYWSESKAIGGSFRAYVVVGYIMAISGFTMVYGTILLLALPYILPMFMELTPDKLLAIEQLASDMLYVLIVLAVVPTGFWIWFKSIANFWEHKTLRNALNAGWNTFAQYRNTVNAIRYVPSSLKRISSSLFGGKGKKKSDSYIVAMAIFVLILAIFSGYFTASAIMKKADREYDAFAYAEKEYLRTQAQQSRYTPVRKRRR